MLWVCCHNIMCGVLSEDQSDCHEFAEQLTARKRLRADSVNAAEKAWLQECSNCNLIWVNYNDLTRPHPKWWFLWGIAPKSPYVRLVKYYNSDLMRIWNVQGIFGWLFLFRIVAQICHAANRMIQVPRSKSKARTEAATSPGSTR